MNLMLRGSPLQAGAASLVSPLVGFASTLQCTHHTGAACHCSLLRVHPSLGAASLYSAISPLVGFGCTPAWHVRTKSIYSRNLLNWQALALLSLFDWEGRRSRH